MKIVQKYENQFVAEDYEKLIREKPSNLYLASRIRGIR